MSLMFPEGKLIRSEVILGMFNGFWSGDEVGHPRFFQMKWDIRGPRSGPGTHRMNLWNVLRTQPWFTV